MAAACECVENVLGYAEECRQSQMMNKLMMHASDLAVVDPDNEKLLLHRERAPSSMLGKSWASVLATMRTHPMTCCQRKVLVTKVKLFFFL